MLKQLRAALVGQDAATARMTSVLEPLTRPDAWLRPVVPIALVGPTATGKTAMVRAMASAVGAPLLEFDGSALGSGDLRDRVRASIAALLARPAPADLSPPMRLLLIENLPCVDCSSLLWLFGDRPSVYVGESSLPTPLGRVVLVLTITRSSDVAPLKGIDASVARHFGDRVIVLEPANEKHVPKLLDRLIPVATPFSATDRTTATAAFKPEFGYGLVSEAVATIAARLRAEVKTNTPPTAAAVPSTTKRSRDSNDETDVRPLKRRNPRTTASSRRVVASADQRFTDRVVDEKSRRANWVKLGFNAKLDPAVRQLNDALQALVTSAAIPTAGTAAAPNNDALVRAILTHRTIWPLLASTRTSAPLLKAIVRDLLLLTHGSRFHRDNRLSGLFPRQFLDRTWIELRLNR